MKEGAHFPGQMANCTRMTIIARDYLKCAGADEQRELYCKKLEYGTVVKKARKDASVPRLVLKAFPLKSPALNQSYVPTSVSTTPAAH